MYTLTTSMSHWKNVQASYEFERVLDELIELSDQVGFDDCGDLCGLDCAIKIMKLNLERIGEITAKRLLE